jgi:hypothetical protein
MNALASQPDPRDRASDGVTGEVMGGPKDVLVEGKCRITHQKSRSVYRRFGRVQSAIVSG